LITRVAAKEKINPCEAGPKRSGKKQFAALKKKGKERKSTILA